MCYQERTSAKKRGYCSKGGSATRAQEEAFTKTLATKKLNSCIGLLNPGQTYPGRGRARCAHSAGRQFFEARPEGTGSTPWDDRVGCIYGGIPTHGISGPTFRNRRNMSMEFGGRSSTKGLVYCVCAEFAVRDLREVAEKLTVTGLTASRMTSMRILAWLLAVSEMPTRSSLTSLASMFFHPSYCCYLKDLLLAMSALSLSPHFGYRGTYCCGPG